MSAALSPCPVPNADTDAAERDFVAAPRGVDAFECRSRFTTWLTRILLNIATGNQRVLPHRARVAVRATLLPHLGSGPPRLG
ncbi:MAG: hypothetical protein ACRDTC_23035 [Pseudonocardiaceae bacterium]